jgi:hypothetical protein
MFARCVTMHLKPNMTAEFKQTLETSILPLLKRRQGFQDELVLIAPDGREAIGISLWDNQQHAQEYAQQSYSEVQQLLSKVTDQTPVVQTYEVSSSTFNKIAAKGGGAASA